LWYAWAVVWLLASALVRRLPLEPRNWPWRLAMHLGAGVVLVLFKFVLDYPIIKTFYCSEPHRLTFLVFYRMALTGHFYPYVLISWSMFGVAHALASHGKSWERGVLASRLQARLAQAQLQVLKMQLHPHFLCNTLNTISALIHVDVELADRMVARLGNLLRFTLEQVGVEEAPLRWEMRFLEAYLEIERARYGERLRVVWDVEPGVQGALVPSLLLQPLVENALRHGVGRKPGPGRIIVRARRTGRRLCLQVEDDGPGLPLDLEEGIGLANTRARLRQLYDDDHLFEIQGAPAGGARVTVELPLRRAGERPVETETALQRHA
jgi:LytS/YehU family sensor histidine kinase